MKCNVVKDLLPSYIDGICSQETIEEVEAHLQNCEECRRTLKMMQQHLEPTPIISEEDTIKAKMPFRIIKKKKRIQIIATIVLTFILTVISYQVVQNVGSVHDVFFPQIGIAINSTNDATDWERLYFNESEYLVFDSIFFNKDITNHANSDGDVTLRVKDIDNNILLDNLLISPGKSMSLGKLKNNKKYIVEVKSTEGRFFINIH